MRKTIKRQMIKQNLIILIGVSVFFTISGIMAVRNIILDNSKNLLKEFTEYVVGDIKNSSESYLQISKTLAVSNDMLSINLNQKEKVALLSIISETFDIQSIGLIAPSGIYLDDLGRQLDMNNFMGFKAAKEGNAYVTSPHILSKEEGFVVSFTAPIMQKEEIVGVIMINQKAESFFDAISKTKTANTSHIHIIDHQKNIVHLSKEYGVLAQGLTVDKLLDSYPQAKALASVYNTMVEGKKGVDEFRFNGEAEVMAYAPVEGTTWIAGISINKQELMKEMDTVFFTFSIIAIMAIFAGVVIAVYISQGLSKRLGIAKQAVEKMAQGDFTPNTKKFAIDDEISDIYHAINKGSSNIAHMIRDIKTQSDQLEGYSKHLEQISSHFVTFCSQIGMAVEEANKGNVCQAEDLLQISENLSDLDTKMNGTHMEVDSTNQMIGQINEQSKSSNKDMQSLQIGMEGLKLSFDDFVKMLYSMKDNVGSIYDIAKFIGSISEQTNLLSLNASIEAARAGEAGRGFTVVAEEVGKLAIKSQSSLKGIQDRLDRTMSQIEGVTQKSDDISENIKAYIEKVQTGVDSFNQITHFISDITVRMDEIADNTTHINKNKDTIIDKIESSSSIAEEMTANTEEIAASTQELEISSEEIRLAASQLNEVVINTRKMLQKFKIDEVSLKDVDFDKA